MNVEKSDIKVGVTHAVPEQSRLVFIVAELSVSVIWLIRVIHITVLGVVTRLQCNKEKRGRLDPVVIKDLYPRDECNEALNEAISQISVTNDLLRHKRIEFSIPRHTVHDIKFRLFIGKSDSRDEVSAKINAQDQQG
jgi:hypothetical protein